MQISSFRRRAVFLLGLTAALAGSLRAQSVTYLYDGDLTPSQGEYAGWFTTVGPGHPTNSYFLDTTWASSGNVLTMATSVSPSEGIWFGRTSGYGDPSNFSLASTADGNLVRSRLALGPSSSEWSIYWYDTDGYGSSLYFLSNGVQFGYMNESSVYTGGFFPIADMTAFHTYTSYVLAGQVSYFVDGTYLGGGGALPGGVSNFLLVGDGSAADVSGYGTFRIDYLEIITAVGASAPSIAAVPEPATGAALAGVCVLGWVAIRRRRLGCAQKAIHRPQPHPFRF